MASKKASIEIAANVAKAIAGMNKLGASIDNASDRVADMGDQMKKAQQDVDRFGAIAQKVFKAAVAGTIASAAKQAISATIELAEETRRVEGIYRTLPFSITEASRATGGFATNLDLATAAARASAMGVADNSGQFADLAEVAACSTLLEIT